MAGPLAEARTAASWPVALRIDVGDVVHLVGPNGCGKTSLLRALAGLRPWIPVSGVRVAGNDPRAMAARDMPAQVAAAWQAPRDGLVGLTVHGEFRMRRREAPSSLDDLSDRPVARLSSGEARHVALAAAGDTPLLLLDEPLEDLDEEHVEMLRHQVRAAARRGGVVFTDHTGRLADEATIRLEMGAAPPRKDPDLPAPPATGSRIEAPERFVAERRVHLPAVDLGPGFHVVEGPNGSGKSTLLLWLVGVLGPADGPAPRAAAPPSVRIDGAPPEPGANVRLLPAEARTMFSRDSVGEEVAGVPGALRDRFGVDALLDRHPLTLSGGEAKRVALAKVFARPAPVILLDEPEADLDEAGRAALWACIAEAVAAGRVVLAATHDPQAIGIAQSRIEVAR